MIRLLVLLVTSTALVMLIGRCDEKPAAPKPERSPNGCDVC